ncbi:MAG: hypothetical protein IT384_00190 [Deltaproteobacteria bacterium]|nr:hypothetical protein [Deltaproteobacteria bacterium]
MLAALALAVGTALSGQTATASVAPFSPEQLEYLERMQRDARRASERADAKGASKLELRAEIYMKWLFQNDATQGCVTYGNPHPSGDNYAGNNGACPELALTVTGRPIAQLEAGFRLQSRYGQSFADWFENGDKKTRADASGESLGQNHSAPIQLRGIYVRVSEPLPAIDWFLAGSSDLGFWDPWTVGRVRFIDRYNAKGLFLKTGIPDALDILVARIAMPKLFGTANYSDLEEPLVTNPFWARDAVYALQLATPASAIDGLTITLNGALLLDEEADVRDPDAPGSTNAVDLVDGVTATDGRFVGANGSLTVRWEVQESIEARGVFAVSHNSPNEAYVTNLARGGLGFSNVVFDEVTDVAGTLRVSLPDLFDDGFGLQLEYFNIGADYNAVMGSRREDDVLLTDGFLDGGELPTLNLANELVDFSDSFFESAVGWHGGTVVIEEKGNLLDANAEATVLTYNTNLQGRDMDTYPGFGGFTGYADTQLFSYANTNDRGADPRAVYRRDQDRLSLIFAAGGALKPDWWRGARIDAQVKLIVDQDRRNAEVVEDDYLGRILVSQLSVGAQPFEALRGKVGLAIDHWSEQARSGTFAGGVPRFDDYRTTRLRPYAELGYTLGPLSASYHLELVRKTVDLSPDVERSYQVGWIVRSIGWLSAYF